jgi:hypothetical protein
LSGKFKNGKKVKAANKKDKKTKIGKKSGKMKTRRQVYKE